MRDVALRDTLLHDGEALLRALLPLDGFDLLAAVPYMLELRRRHAASHMRALWLRPEQ